MALRPTLTTTSAFVVTQKIGNKAKLSYGETEESQQNCIYFSFKSIYSLWMRFSVITIFLYGSMQEEKSDKQENRFGTYPGATAADLLTLIHYFVHYVYKISIRPINKSLF